jgi:hypothetical protein
MVNMLTVRLLLPLFIRAEIITTPQQPASLLMPAAGLVHRSFPPLILIEQGEGPGLRLRRTANSSKKRQSVGKRRAISELMVSSVCCKIGMLSCKSESTASIAAILKQHDCQTGARQKQSSR